ncbi:F-box DNA helicase 1 [Parus major]|uniref:F-box DNA helicase 1 n=1 Tax=Parus major TaxID=9157 RepID=UPI0014442A68|nr:F-box DNA helicase 1 [Parus major]
MEFIPAFPPAAPGRQRSILDFCGIRSRGIEEDPLDPCSSSPPDSCLFQHSQLSVPPPTAHSRKRPLPSAPSGIPTPELDLWDEPQEKIPQLLQQEWEELEVEPLPDSHYGLLGTRNWEFPQGSMDSLPAEILRNIFALLPVLDLYQNLSLVCHSWREIIRDPLFIPWKKLYHRYLKGEHSALQAVEQILQEFSITKENQECVLGLVRLVASKGAKVDPNALLRILGTHPLFPKAQICVHNKFPDLLSKPGVSFTKVFLGFFKNSCRRLPDPELLFLVIPDLSLYFYFFPRIHYNIFYCLYLMENSSGIAPPPEEGREDLCSSGRADVKLTHEQQRILNHKIEPGQTVKIMAFAGTGKTSTLVKYAEKFPELKFLYLAFNRAVVEKGKKVFPRNVTCKTFHSLAFGSAGRCYKDKGKLNFSKMSVFSISSLLRNCKGQSLFVRGKTVAQTLENFFSSWDEEISEEHVPLWFRNTHGNMERVSPEEKRINVEEAREIWHNMKELDGDVEKKYKMTCDGYLKLWQLSKPQLSGYDAIFVDEAQDCTPAIVDIVQSQKCGKILVGDPHQQIYTFRGAVNTLYSLPHSHVFYLTQSFRFGPEIAYVGSTILDLCKGIRGKTLLGGTQKGEMGLGKRENSWIIVGLGMGTGNQEFLAGMAVDNWEFLLGMAVDIQEFLAGLAVDNWEFLAGLAVDIQEFLAGMAVDIQEFLLGMAVDIQEFLGLQRFGLGRILDIWKLSQPPELRKNDNLEIEDPFIRRWEASGGFPALREFAACVQDRDLEGKISIVEKYRERIPELLRRIRASHVSQESLADYLLGTVHQAKGQEFDSVWVADDFVQISSMAFLRRANDALGEEQREKGTWEWGWRVGMGHGSTFISLRVLIFPFFRVSQEHFLRVELLSEAAPSPIPCCVLGCTKSLEFRSGLVVKKLPLSRSDGSRDLGGFLCQACTQQFFGSLAPLVSFPTIQEKPIQP